MGVRHVMGSLVFVVCLLRTASAQPTNRTETASASDLLEQGFTDYGDGDYKAAVTSFEKVLILQPTHCQASLYLGYSHYYLTQFNEALVALTVAARCPPIKTEALFWQGQTLYCLRRFDQAASAYQKTLELDPDQPQAWFGLGCCQYYLNAYEVAAQSFAQSASQEPTNYDAHIWTGYSLVRADHFEPAAAAFQRAIDLRPTDFDANLWRGISLLRLWRFADATGNLEQAHRIRPRDRSIREFLLACYLVTGQMQKIPGLQLGSFLIISIILLVAYVPSTVLVFRKSLELDSRPAPRLRFALAWCSVTFLGQSVLMFVLFLMFSSLRFHAIGLGIILAILPLIIAALLGFARQPWGGVFVWPPKVPRPKVILLAGVAVIGVMIFDHHYTSWVMQIRGRPMPEQLITRWLGSAVGSWPWSALLAIGVAAPLAEEILFRGLLYAAIRTRLSAAWTIITTAALFTSLHLQPLYFPEIFALGVVLGWARHKSEGLLLPVMIHGFNNSVALLAASLYSAAR